MTFIKTVLKVGIKMAIVAGVLALLGAAAYGVAQNRRGSGSTSFEDFPDVAVNPLANQAA